MTSTEFAATVGLLSSDVYEDISAKYNSICTENATLRIKLKQMMFENTKLKDYVSSYENESKEFTATINSHKTQLIKNNQIYLESLKTFQLLISKVCTFKRMDTSTTDNYYTTGNSIIKTLNEMKQMLDHFHLKCKGVSIPIISYDNNNSNNNMNQHDQYSINNHSIGDDDESEIIYEKWYVTIHICNYILFILACIYVFI